MKCNVLIPTAFSEIDNICSLWLVCQKCSTILQGSGDPAMFVLLSWGREQNIIDELPNSLSMDPMRLSRLVNYIDSVLNNNIRKKLGNRFPAFLTTPNETDKLYFLHRLEKDILLRIIFLHEIEEASQRASVGLRLWANATIAAKATRPTYNVLGGQQSYSLEDRQKGFQAADTYAQADRVCMLGVQIAPILELLIRGHNNISLEGANPNSEIRKYLKVKGKNVISKEDIEIRDDSSAV